MMTNKSTLKTVARESDAKRLVSLVFLYLLNINIEFYQIFIYRRIHGYLSCTQWSKNS